MVEYPYVLLADIAGKESVRPSPRRRRTARLRLVALAIIRVTAIRQKRPMRVGRLPQGWALAGRPKPRPCTFS